MIRVFNKFETIPPGYVEVDTTSRGPFKDLSPFYLGPIDYNCPFTGPVRCQRFENLWQYCKVYPEHVDHNTKEPLPQYYEWRNAGFANRRAVRYPMGKGAKPLFSLWSAEHYDYVTARRIIYVPLYADLVIKTSSYEKVYNWVLQGHDIALRDFDGYDHMSQNMTLRDVIFNPKRSMGHAFVIFGLLTGELATSLN